MNDEEEESNGWEEVRDLIDQQDLDATRKVLHALVDHVGVLLLRVRELERHTDIKYSAESGLTRLDELNPRRRH